MPADVKGNDFWKAFSRLIAERGLTQADVARAIGVSRQTIQEWRTKRRRPRYDNLEALAVLFDVSIDELFGGVSGDGARQSRRYSGGDGPIISAALWRVFVDDYLRSERGRDTTRFEREHLYTDRQRAATRDVIHAARRAIQARYGKRR